MRIGSRAAALITGLALTLTGMGGLASPASAAYSPDPIGPTGWTPDGAVLAVVSAGDRVYVGGAFTGGVAALDAGTGALLWTATANGAVRALAMSSDGTHLIAGGGFTAVDGAAHRKLASLRVADGTAEPRWRAAAGGLVRDLVVVGDTAYFGGTFTQHAGVAQRSLGAVSVTTGSVVSSFTTATDGYVYALATNGSRLFIGGKFTLVDGQARSSLASVTLASDSLNAWAPARQCTGCSLYWDLALEGSTIYGVGRNGGAVVALDQSTAARRWRVTANGDAQAVTVSGGLVYVGGHFTSIGNPTQPRTILAALDPATGAVDPAFTPRFVTTYPGIWALDANGSTLFAGGYFTAAGPTKRFPYFAMFGTV